MKKLVKLFLGLALVVGAGMTAYYYKYLKDRL